MLIHYFTKIKSSSETLNTSFKNKFLIKSKFARFYLCQFSKVKNKTLTLDFFIILQPVHKPRRDQDPDLRGRDGQGLGQGLSNPGLNNLENVTRVRLVQFQRNTDEPMGITLKLSEDGKKCFKFMAQPNLNEAQSQNFVTISENI